MPLVRVEVRNEFGLGAPELYREVADREDPKAVLDGVAVAGLVGILRQLGDLAEFAAEVFHGLQEQVVNTSSRSRKLMARVQRIESSLPPLEKLVVAQRSHIHFAYTAGSNWHARVRCEKNHFIYNDLPQFILDSYEECRGPPRLHLLDKFDPGGPGSCLRRYSDPTFFKSAAAGSDDANLQKSAKNKSRKIKRKKSLQRNGRASRGSSFSYDSGRNQFSEGKFSGQIRSSQIITTHDSPLESNADSRGNSSDSRNGFVQSEAAFYPSYHAHPEKQESKKFVSSISKEHPRDSLNSTSFDEKTWLGHDDIDEGLLQEQTKITPSPHHRDVKKQPEGRDYGGSYFSPSVSLDNDSIDYSFPEEKNKTGCDNLDYRGTRELKGNHHQSAETHPKKWPSEELEVLEPLCNRISAERSSLGKFCDNRDSLSQELSDCSSPVSSHVNEWPLEGTGVKEHLVNRTPSRLSTSGYLWDTSNSVLQELSGPRSPLVESHPTEWMLKEPAAEKGKTIPAENLNLEKLGDIANSTLQHPVGPGSSSVTSDEKTDVVEGTRRNYYEADELEKHSTDLYWDSPNKEAHQRMIPGLNNLCVVTSVPNNIWLDDFESETDNYMDALNTIESESETDLDCQTKLAKQDYNLKRKPLDDGAEPRADPSEVHSPTLQHDNGTTSFQNLEFHVDNQDMAAKFDCVASHSSEKVTCEDGSISVSPECNGQLGSPWAAQISSGPANPCETGILGCSDTKSLAGGPSTTEPRDHGLLSTVSLDGKFSSTISREQSSGDAMSDKIASSHSETQKPCAETSNATAVQFWTNGGLLGLEPSKPPAYNSINTVNQASLASEDETADSLPDNQVPSSGKHTGKLHNLSHVNDPPANDPLPDGIDVQTSKAYGYGRRSSRMRELGTRLKNSSSSYSSGHFEQTNRTQNAVYRTFSGRIKDFSRNGSPSMSPCSSPPLQHMKLSFQPLDGLKNSTLRLKLPDENSRSDSSREMFPSFQLVPETATLRHDIGSVSDDDTFRSSPYISDDCLSPQSESNSEQWESGKSPSHSDHEMYDALRRISLTESTSVYLENGTASQEEFNDSCRFEIPDFGNGAKHTLSAHFSDLPSLDLSSTFKESVGNNSNNKDHQEQQIFMGTSPLPPPLPPVQWRAMKAQSDVPGSREDATSGLNALNYEFDQTVPGSTISHQPKPAPLDQDQLSKTTNTLRTELSGPRKINQHKEANRDAGFKKFDEKEGDLLHQIREKAFRLRRTMTEKPTATSGAQTNVKITAILEKANAIRQAVGSDDGEDDDNWSDI